MNTIEKIIAWFKENEDVFNNCIEELDSYNGYLADDRYYEMDELDEFYHDVNPTELLNRVYFGYDEDDYTFTSTGEKINGQFNPTKAFFKYNGYGNLVSTDWKDYSAYIDKYAIKSMNENREYINTIEENEELAELFDELENEEEEE